jgi:hypothetical protein
MRGPRDLMPNDTITSRVDGSTLSRKRIWEHQSSEARPAQHERSEDIPCPAEAALLLLANPDVSFDGLRRRLIARGRRGQD